MPLPSFGFGHRPSWEYEAPDASGATLEEPEPQPIRKGWKGKVAVVTGGATGLGRAVVMEFGKLGCNVAFCFVNLPGSAKGFTTIELKSNFLGTKYEGTIECEAKLTHGGRATQIWDATVADVESGKKLALFRCTQMILYPRDQ